VTFSAAAIGVSSAVLTIGNNDCNESAYTFAVKGEVTCSMPAIATLQMLVSIQ
jgi:hypothetical protein